MPGHLEVIKLRDIVFLKELSRFVPDMEKPTLEVIGEDFNSVDAIFLNGVSVAEYTIVNTTTLWLTIPDEVTGRLRTLEVLSSNFTKTAIGSKVRFMLGTRADTVSGILRLTQLYIKWLLQSPGSDIFNPNRGGGLKALTGSLVDIDRMDPILSAITRAVETTNSQIRNAQVSATKLPLDERLMSGELLGVVRDRDRTEAHARIRIVSMSGDDATSALVL